jgi:PAS domain S-box-containing protein
LVLIAVLPALGIILNSGLEQRKTDIKDVHERALFMARSLAAEREQLVDSAGRLLRTLSGLPEIQEQDAGRLNRTFRNLVKNNTLYGVILIATPDGKVFASSHASAPKTIADRKYFKTVLASGDFSGGEYAISKTHTIPCMPFAYPVKDESGRIRSILVGSLIPYDNKHFPKDVSLLEDCSVGIADRSGIRPYSYSDPGREPTGIGKAFPPDIVSRILGPLEEGSFEDAGPGGILHIYAFKKIRPQERLSQHLYVVVGVAKEKALAVADRQMIRNMLLLAAAALLAFGAAWLIGNLTIANRLDRLVNAARQFEEGNLKIRSSLDYADGMLGHLFRTLDGVAEKVERESLERKRAEEALTEQLMFLQALIDAVPIPIFFKDTKGIYQGCNKAFEMFYSISRDQIVGKTAYDIAPADLAEVYCHADLEVLSTPGTRMHESSVVDRTGTKRDVILNKAAYKDRNGQVAGVIGAIFDITDRKEAEAALRGSEKRYRSIFENTVEGIFQSTPDGRFISVNPAMARMCGYDSPAGMMQSVHSIDSQLYVHPEEREVFKKILDEQGFIRDFEHATYRKDGSIFYVSVNARTVCGPEGRALYYEGTHEDITWRREAEKALRQREATLQSILRAAPIGIGVVRSRVFEWANDEMIRMMGYSREELIGRSVRMLYESDEEFERVGTVKYGQIRERGIGSVETRWRRKNGTIVDIYLSSSMIDSDDLTSGAVFTATDITWRKEAEAAFKADRELLVSILDGIPAPAFVIDRDRSVILWNRYNEIYTGVRKEDVLGKPLDLVPFSGGRATLSLAEMLLFHTESEILDKYGGRGVKRSDVLPRAIESSAQVWIKGEERLLEVQAARIIGPHGGVMGAIQTSRDITERVRLEAQLQRAQKMEALGMLAGGVAHDLNNILGGLVSYPDLLLMQTSDDSPLRGPLMTIKRSGEKAAAVVQDLLTLARRGVTTKEVVDLNRIIRDYFNTPEHEKLKADHPHVRYELHLDETLLPIMGSTIHLAKTVMNLLSNAVEAMPDGGVVKISTGNHYIDRPIVGYDEMREGDFATLVVSDTGKGISPGDMGRIFEPFYTKKIMGRSGTGLGLAVVWGTVKDHHGHIDVKSEKGKGTTLTLYIPVTREGLTKKQQGEVSPDEYQGRGERVLIVDDVAEQRELAAFMLNKLGYTVATVSSGEEAIEYIKSRSADILVLDMIMDSGMDGLDTYKEILQLKPTQKAIIVSGFSETDRVREAQKLGVGVYVKKPYVMEKIGLAVRRELDRS